MENGLNVTHILSCTDEVFFWSCLFSFDKTTSNCIDFMILLSSVSELNQNLLYLTHHKIENLNGLKVLKNKKA